MRERPRCGATAAESRSKIRTHPVTSKLLLCRLGLHAAGAAAILFWATASSAQTSGCGKDVLVTGALTADWEEAVARVCVALRGMADRDANAQVSIAPDGSDGIIVSVQLTDGRTAVRRLRVPDQLDSVIEALVALPPEDRTDPPIEPAPPPLPASTPPRLPTRDTVDLSGDVAVLGATRVLGDPGTFATGLIVSADLDIAHGWIVGLRGRADPLNVGMEGEGELTGGTFGGGVELARRLYVAAEVALDLGVGADGLVDIPYDGGRGLSRSADDATGDVRPRVFGKVWVPRGSVAFTGLIGFEVSPLRLASKDDEGPSFGGEVAVGVGWGELR